MGPNKYGAAHLEVAIIIWAPDLAAQLPKDELIHFHMFWHSEQ